MRPFDLLRKEYLYLISTLLLIFPKSTTAQEYRRWQINADGSIIWTIDKKLPHADHIEMSGQRIACILRYKVNADSSFYATRSLVWPMLRTIPNNTHASLTRRFKQDGFDLITINYKPLEQEKVSSITLDGTVLVKSHTLSGMELQRQFFPSTKLPGYCELYTLKNTSGKDCIVEVPDLQETYVTDSSKGTEGSYSLHLEVTNSGSHYLKNNDSLTYSIIYSGSNKSEPAIQIVAENERFKRLHFIQEMWSKLVLETPDTVLNREFAFAKIRGAESIYATKGGPMHGPGGEAYYAAIWANDQAEYIGPFFPYLGYDYGNQASLNAYLHFARYMNDAFKPIPSSIIAEGTDIWNGAGDRGDAAMIAYGAARYALASGDVTQAKKLWPLIQWCLEYCRRKLNSDGVVTSNSDELEGRLPSGNANLCTSTLYYDALNSSVYISKILGERKSMASDYKKEAQKLKLAIEKYFGATIDGFKTYRYYKGNDTLRAWICIPLTMGIYDRAQGTIDALFSPRLWTEDGLASIAGEKTFWDRSTLYALRGVLGAGATDTALNFLHSYSERRLLGDHVPYPVEAYPEGDQRHLSAESGLYCRIYTEGLFGIRPTGLHSFKLSPRMPSSWQSMSLRHIYAFNGNIDINVKKVNNGLHISVTNAGKMI
ncbi:MAG TPA: hypothetical protein VJ499_11815, partial [Flavisolibacter sp.]|nr:hypothetical protein [Flavisolibacter sp.]